MDKRWKRNVVFCFPDVLRDDGDAPANLLCQLNGHVVPCASCLHRKWIENVGASQFGNLSILFCAVLLAAPPGLAAVLPMWDSAYVSGTVTSPPWVSFGLRQESGPIWAFVVVTHQSYWLFNCWDLGSLDRLSLITHY